MKNAISLCILPLLTLSLPHFAHAQEQFADTIPFTINQQNTLYVQAVFNETDTLNLNFDTGTSDLVLTTEVLNNKLKSPVNLYNETYNIKIGGTVYQTKVYDAVLTGHDTDGRFGWNFFSGKVVELNYDKDILVVHMEMPEELIHDTSYTQLDISYFANVFSVKTTLLQGEAERTDTFLFDTGYQRTAMLDDDILTEARFPVHQMKEIKKVIMKGGQGNEVPVITSELESIKIGDFLLYDVPVQRTTVHKPMKQRNMHILGNEILKRFNIFLDFQNHKVYLKPNHLYHVAYIEKG